jgi:hypothetical protein
VWSFGERNRVVGGGIGWVAPPELNCSTAPNNLLQRWSVSKRVNSSKALADDPTLIDKIA